MIRNLPQIKKYSIFLCIVIVNKQSIYSILKKFNITT